MAVEAPYPALGSWGRGGHLAGAVPAGHAPGAPALVAGLHHPRVRHRHHPHLDTPPGLGPHLLFEHVGGRLLHLPGQRRRAAPRPVHLPALVRRVRPARLPLLREGLQLVVVGRHVVHAGDLQLLGGAASVAALARDVGEEGGARLLVGQAHLQ